MNLKLKRGMHDSDRRTNHSLEMSSKAFARSRLSASHILIIPHSATYRSRIAQQLENHGIFSVPDPNMAYLYIFNIFLWIETLMGKKKSHSVVKSSSR